MGTSTLLVAASSGGTHYGSAIALLILGLFCLFGSVAVLMRTSMAGDPNVPVEDDPNAPFEVKAARWMMRGEKRRARFFKPLSRALVVLGVGLLLAAGVSALVAWV